MYYNNGNNNVENHSDKNCFKVEAIELFLQLHQMLKTTVTVEVLQERTEGVVHILRLEEEELRLFVEVLKDKILFLESRLIADQDGDEFGVDTTVFFQSDTGPDF